MLTSLRNVFLALLLGGAAAASWYMSLTPVDPRTPAARNGASELGYYLLGAVLRGTNAEGRLVYQISADRVDEDPDETRIQLQNVEISYFETEEIPWLARAARATAPRSREFIDLEGSVTLSTTGSDTGAPTLIETDRMRFEPERYVAVTDGPARVTVGDNWLDAAQLEANLKDDVIHSSDVHASVSR